MSVQVAFNGEWLALAVEEPSCVLTLRTKRASSLASETPGAKKASLGEAETDLRLVAGLLDSQSILRKGSSPSRRCRSLAVCSPTTSLPRTFEKFRGEKGLPKERTLRRAGGEALSSSSGGSGKSSRRQWLRGVLGAALSVSAKSLALDLQRCHLAVKDSPLLLSFDLVDGLRPQRGLLPSLQCIDTRAFNREGRLGVPSQHSPIWVGGERAKQRVRVQALRQLCFAGPFLGVVKTHERMQLLLLPQSCLLRRTCEQAVCV